jgi:signal transduction histidine kinase
VSSLLARFASAERVTGRVRVVVLLLAALATVAIALPNVLFDVALRTFYLAPVVVVTVLVSSRWGLAYAVAAGLAWTFDHVGADSVDTEVEVLNAVLRVLGFVLLVALVSTLRDAIERSRASERRSKEFLAFAAHQLRTPVAGMRASAEALVLTDDPAGREQLLAGITREAGRMGRLVAALLRMTRLDQGEPLSPVPVDVAAELVAEVERARLLAPALEVSLDISPSPAPAVLVDRGALAEMVANLLDNARRHASSTISVRAQVGERTLEVVVADDGSGLPVGAEEGAFERFVSLDGHGGSGLGLPIARALAEAHGGSLVWADRRFVLRLSVSPAPPPPTSPVDVTPVGYRAPHASEAR